MRKRVFFGILGIAAAVLGVEVTRDDTADSAAIGVAASGSVPLRIEFSLAERAHAAAPQPPAAADESAAAAVGLRMELAMSAPPDAGPAPAVLSVEPRPPVQGMGERRGATAATASQKEAASGRAACGGRRRRRRAGPATGPEEGRLGCDDADSDGGGPGRTRTGGRTSERTGRP